MDTSSLLSVAQVAEELGIPKLEVNRRIRAGDITASKVGWSWVILKADLEIAKNSDWYQKRRKALD